MWDERKPDETRTVTIDGGYTLYCDRFGSGADVLLCLNGGPGLPCDYLREAHSCLADKGYTVVAYDQLGCGRSDRPDDPKLWDIARYVEEVEQVRTALGLGRVHLMGHSWGGWLSIEYALTYPDNVKTLILLNTCGDMPHLQTELNRMREALGPETVAMMQRHEALGSFDHPEYQAAITVLNYRHVCRLEVWPAPVVRSVSDWNMGPYGTMQGPNEFLYVGNLKDWRRLDQMGRIACPALIVTGLHDEIGPPCAMRMRHALPNAEIAIFKNSSHVPFYEEPAEYYPALEAFLAKHR
jgi:proline iminopeptidase